MKRFQVTAVRTIKYLIEVDAEDSDDAEAMARRQWNLRADKSTFDHDDYGIEITHVIDENGQHA